MIALLWMTLSWGSIAVERPAVEGVATVLVVSDADGNHRGGETVRVVHRPGLSGEREIAIGITDGLGRVRWTPEIAGVALLKAGDEVLPLRIGWPGVPLQTAVLFGLLTLAGVWSVLFGLRPTGSRGRRRHQAADPHKETSS